jgi:RNA polymerase sigma-70 factor (ECF subfamily)
MKIGRNLIIDHYRQTRRFQHAAGTEEMESMNLHDERTPSPHQEIEQTEAAEFLREGLQALSPELKESIILRDLEGMSYLEIAELLSVPEGTVKSRINRGRLELAKLLTRRRVQARMEG